MVRHQLPLPGARIGAGTEIKLNLGAIDEQLEVAKQAGVKVRPQIVGPLTLLLGAKAEQGSAEDFSPVDRLDEFVCRVRSGAGAAG